jgi:hypothetical protein
MAAGNGAASAALDQGDTAERRRDGEPVCRSPGSRRACSTASEIEPVTTFSTSFGCDEA